MTAAASREPGPTRSATVTGTDGVGPVALVDRSVVPVAGAGRSGRHHDDGEVVPAAVLERDRWRRVDDVLRAAWERMPLYRRRFEAHGFEPGPIVDAADFAARVPRTRKSDLVEATRAAGSIEIGIEALDEPMSHVVMTSGTQGFNTFGVLSHADLSGANLLGQARELWMIGVRPGMRVLTMSPAWHVLALVESAALTHIGALPIVPWGTYTPVFARGLIEAIRAHEPEHLLATAPMFDAMLAECERSSLDAAEAFASVRYVGCAGRALSAPYRRHLLDAMGLDDVFERGGSSDGMFGGGECEAHRGHHLFADLHYVEVVDPATGVPLPPGMRGSAVVTNLTAGRSVYIRFDTEDVAEVIDGECPCGRTHPVVEFYGRLDECVRIGDRIVAPVDVRDTLDAVPDLRTCMITLAPLEAADGVRVHVHDGGGLSDEVLAQAAGRVESSLAVPVEVVRGPATTSGWKGQVVRQGLT